MRSLVGAVDIGGTKIELAIADAAGTLVASERFATRPERGPETVLAEIVERFARMRGEIEGALDCVGVASAGPLDLEAGLMVSPPNFAGWGTVELTAPLAAGFGVPVRLDNDANAAALGEFWWGAGRGTQNMVYVTISTGVGGGVIVRGRLLHGVGAGAGELGHQTIRADGPVCGCGNKGCLEAIASGTAIARAAKDAVMKGEGRLMQEMAHADGGEIHAGHVVQASSAGDLAAQRIWNEVIEALAIGLGNVVTILAPDCIVIGGGVSQVGDALFLPLRERIAARVRLVPIDTVRIVPAQLGASVGVMGAVALALRP